MKNLRTLAEELEDLSRIQLKFETDKRMYTQQIQSLETKIEQLNCELNRIKKADETKLGVISELQLKLVASTLEKNALTEVNLKCAAKIDSLMEKLEAVRCISST